MGRVSDTWHMFTPERTALVVLAASLLIFAGVVMCSRSSLGEPVPMVTDTLDIAPQIDTVNMAKPDKKKAHKKHNQRSKPKPGPERPSAPVRDHWNEIVPQQ